MQSEYEKLGLVKENILVKMATLGEGLAEKRTGVLEVRKEMWREARIVLRDFDDVADLTIFAEEVARHENQYVQASEEIKKLGKMLDSPYFARIDFIESGAACDEDSNERGQGDLSPCGGSGAEPPRSSPSPSEQIYIGRHSLFDDSAQSFLVYDWRAPISSLYYDYGAGAARFTVPGTGAVINGEILLKRQYQIEKGELVYLFDNDMAIEDEILRLELSKATEARIKTIVNTIQADQNRAIRAEAGDILVYGPAGCGKTSVGLHRLAYLLYRHRESLSSAKVRIFSPNEIFSSYIAGIIPALGEEDVQTLDFTALLEGKGKNSRNGRGFRSPEEMLESLAARADGARTEWIKAKFSAAFCDLLEKYIAAYEPTFEDVFFFRDKICGATRLKSLYQDRTAQGTLASKTERVMMYVQECYAEYFNANRRKVADIFNDINDDNYSDGAIRAKFDEERNIALADIRNRSFPAAAKILEKCLRAWAKRQCGTEAASAAVHFTPARDALRMDSLFFEDALLLLYVDLLAGRVPPEKTVRHILLDEAQDFGVLQHRILRRLYPASRFTVLADTNQALFPEICINETADLQALYPQAEVIPLTKSYRSTYEIMRFAAGLLNAAQSGPDTFLRHGEEPAVLPCAAGMTGALVLEILGGLPNEYNTVGILLPTTGEARAFHAAFKKLYPKGNTPRPLKLITAEAAAFTKGVMVMAAPFAKGLEFDAVICPAYREPRDLRERRLFYLICTRALHRLFLLDCTPRAI